MFFPYFLSSKQALFPFPLPKPQHCFKARIKTGVKGHLECFSSLLVLCGSFWPMSGSPRATTSSPKLTLLLSDWESQCPYGFLSQIPLCLSHPWVKDWACFLPHYLFLVVCFPEDGTCPWRPSEYQEPVITDNDDWQPPALEMPVLQSSIPLWGPSYTPGRGFARLLDSVPFQPSFFPTLGSRPNSGPAPPPIFTCLYCSWGYQRSHRPAQLWWWGHEIK